jgi:hypothetical protein
VCAESLLEAGADLLLVDGVGGDTFFFDELLDLYSTVLVGGIYDIRDDNEQYLMSSSPAR